MCSSDLPPPIVVEPPPPVGELTIDGVKLEPLGKKLGFAVHARLLNKTAVGQTAITLRASLLRDGLPIRERTLACCDDFDTATATQVAQTPGHAHFSTRMNNLNTVKLAPGEARPFTVVFPDAGGDLFGVALTPIVEVKFSETVRGP